MLVNLVKCMQIFCKRHYIRNVKFGTKVKTFGRKYMYVSLSSPQRLCGDKVLLNLNDVDFIKFCRDIDSREPN